MLPSVGLKASKREAQADVQAETEGQMRGPVPFNIDSVGIAPCTIVTIGGVQHQEVAIAGS
jgi:hypothetical protein